MKIKKIKIQNIKGIETLEVNHNVIPNKPNIFVASNGFGKSSFAISFNSLSQKKIKLDQENYHKHDIENRPKIILELEDGSRFEASDSKNEIGKKFDVKVINSQLYPKSSQRKIGGFTSSTANLCVKPITIYNTIPSKVFITYKGTAYKAMFGNLSKMVTNLAPFLKKTQVISLMANNKSAIKTLSSKTNAAKYEAFISVNQGLKGSKGAINSLMVPTKSLDSIPYFKNLVELVCSQKGSTSPVLSDYLDAIQLITVINDNEKDLSKIYKYNNYTVLKSDLDQLISSTNTTWKSIKTKETKGSLKL